MSTSDRIWVFLNAKTKVQTNPMPQSMAHLFILQMKQTELKLYVVWTPGWEKWIPLKEVLKAEQKFFAVPPPKHLTDASATQLTVTRKISAPSYSENTYTEIALNTKPPQSSGDFQPDGVNWEKTARITVLADSSADAPSEEEIKDDDRREYKRFPHRIELVLMTKKGKSFRSSSVNVSLGGALLREPIPAELINDIMDLLFINPFPDKNTPSHLLIKGRVVGDANNRRRLMFYDVSPEVQTKLTYILERYQASYKEFKKKKSA